MPKNHLKSRTAVVAGGALAIVLLLQILPASAQRSPSPTAHPVPGSAGVDPSKPAPSAGRPVSDRVAELFPALGRPAVAADSLGSRTLGGLGFYADQVRRVEARKPSAGPGTAAATRIYVAAGPDDTVCTLLIPDNADGPGGTCVSADEAARGLSEASVEDVGGWDVAGLVPPGTVQVQLTLADGRVTTVAARDGAFSVWVPHRPTSITFEDATGTVAQIP